MHLQFAIYDFSQQWMLTNYIYTYIKYPLFYIYKQIVNIIIYTLSQSSSFISINNTCIYGIIILNKIALCSDLTYSYTISISP